MKVINLLPKPKQKELRYEAVLHSLWLVFIMSILSFALVFVAQFGAKFYLEAQAQSLNNQISKLKAGVNKAQDADLKKQIQYINNEVSDFNNLAAAYPKWSKVIKAFAPLSPPGVKIYSFNIDITNLAITINGYSATRDSVIELYNNILADKTDFYNIDYPLENVVKETNVSFHFTFFIQKQLLQ